MVAEREIPAWQWTRTRPQHSFTESGGQDRDEMWDQCPSNKENPSPNLQVLADPSTSATVGLDPARPQSALSQRLQVFDAGTPHPPWNSYSTAAQALTDVLNCLHEPGADVSFVVILHRDTLVLVVPLEMVGAVWGDVQQGCDTQCIKHVPPGSMVGAAKVEEGKDFHRATLLEKEKNQLIWRGVTRAQQWAGHISRWLGGTEQCRDLPPDPGSSKEGAEAAFLSCETHFSPPLSSSCPGTGRCS